MILVFLMLTSSSVWATKKFGRKTGWKCIQCHQSKKGGDKNLKEEVTLFSELANERAVMRIDAAQDVLNTLEKSEMNSLKKWLEKPNTFRDGSDTIKKYLQSRQSQLDCIADEDKACLLSLLELSVALTKRTTI